MCCPKPLLHSVAPSLKVKPHQRYVKGVSVALLGHLDLQGPEGGPGSDLRTEVLVAHSQRQVQSLTKAGATQLELGSRFSMSRVARRHMRFGKATEGNQLGRFCLYAQVGAQVRPSE